MDKNPNTTKDKLSKKSTLNLSKKRSVISYNNLSPDLLAILKEKYPRGYADYMGEIFKVDKPDGSFFYAISLELPDAIYLVKVDAKIDDYDEASDELFGGGAGDDYADSEEFPEDEADTAYSEEEESDD